MCGEAVLNAKLFYPTTVEKNSLMADVNPIFSRQFFVPWNNAFWPGLTPFGPPMWQAEADTELTLSALPTRAVGQKALFYGKVILISPRKS